MNDQSAARAMPAEVPSEAKVNHQLVRLLESALADAKAGRVVAGAVVAVLGPSNAAAFSAMSVFPLEILGATVMLQADVNFKMRQPRQGAIVRPGLASIRMDG
jgi:hypothetical protein